MTVQSGFCCTSSDVLTCARVQVPLMLQQQKAHVTICNTLGLQGYNTIDMTVWRRHLADRWDALPQDVRIAIIGKYTNLSDAYLSVIKALQHACLAVRRRLTLTWVEAGDIESEVRGSSPPTLLRCRHARSSSWVQCLADLCVAGGRLGAVVNTIKCKPAQASSRTPRAHAQVAAENKAKFDAGWAAVEQADGIVIPGGFGLRGTEGKIAAARYCREHKKPFLGICLGMQVRADGAQSRITCIAVSRRVHTRCRP